MIVSETYQSIQLLQELKRQAVVMCSPFLRSSWYISSPPSTILYDSWTVQISNSEIPFIRHPNSERSKLHWKTTEEDKGDQEATSSCKQEQK